MSDFFASRACPSLAIGFFAALPRSGLAAAGLRDFLTRFGAASFDVDRVLRMIFDMIGIY
ncbi:MAG: hypothetical protein H0V72_10390 [Bradyrhizobium sp.]|nr:hypothetical protein [Bradyrhizobium sp.]